VGKIAGKGGASLSATVGDFAPCALKKTILAMHCERLSNLSVRARVRVDAMSSRGPGTSQVNH
jgi:hypothetical protein